MNQPCKHCGSITWASDQNCGCIYSLRARINELEDGLHEAIELADAGMFDSAMERIVALLGEK